MTATDPEDLELYVNGAPSGEKVTIPAMASGIEDEFTFTYRVPETYDGSPMTFSVSGSNGTKLTQTTSEDAYLEVSNIKFDQLTYLEEDSDSVSYNVTVSVTNTGNDVSEASTFVLSHIENGKENEEEVVKEEVFGSCDVPMVKPGEVKKVRFQVDIPKKYFGENIFHLASVAGALYYDYDPNNVEDQSMVTGFVDYVQADETPEVETLTLAKNKKVGVGQSLNLKVKIVPSTAKEFAGLVYESSNPSIATVDGNGIITGKKPGTCTISVTTKNGIQKKITIQVTKDEAAEDDEEYDPSEISGTDQNQSDQKDSGQNLNNKGASDKKGNSRKDKLQTGDRSPILPILFLLILSGVIMVGIVISKRKKKE